MAKDYPQELRDRVLAAYDRGMKTQQIAGIFLVSKAWARRIKQRKQQTGRTTPLPRGGVTVVKVDPQRLRDPTSGCDVEPVVADQPPADALSHHPVEECLHEHVVLEPLPIHTEHFRRPYRPLDRPVDEPAVQQVELSRLTQPTLAGQAE